MLALSTTTMLLCSSTNKTGVDSFTARHQTDGKSAGVSDDGRGTDVVPTVSGQSWQATADTMLRTDHHSEPYFIWSDECDVRTSGPPSSSAPSAQPREVRVGTSPFGNKCNGGIVLTKENQRSGGTQESSDHDRRRVGTARLLPVLERREPEAEQRYHRESGTFGDRVQQMAFAANTDAKSGGVFSGPIASLRYCRTSSPKGPQTIGVEVGLIPPLSMSDGSEPPIFVRIAGTGSLNQALQCDKRASTRRTDPGRM